MKWIGFQLPYRPCSATYQAYGNQPAVDTSEYGHVTMDNLECLEQSPSPTDCYVEREGDAFYHDSQGCVTWRLRGGKVYADDDLVADSLAEFCARMILENKIWFAVFFAGRRGTPEDLVAHDPKMLAYVQALKANQV